MNEYMSGTAELGCQWHFAPQKGGREDGPNDAMMQNFKASPYSALVREAVQNSLDAVLDLSKPVRVEISFSGLNAKTFTNFYALQEHILECKEYFHWQEKAVALYEGMASHFTKNLMGGNIGYIRVADFNTKGMKYDPKSSQSAFYAFARAAGVSSKVDQQSGGSFGFGKSAYFQLSPIGTVFISSLTDKEKHAFEGVSWLCSHRYKGEKVSSVGYYDNNNGQPITKLDQIPSRFRRKESGTSFYILGFKEYLKEQATEEMISEALKSFWYAIYSNRLVIKIGDEKEINADTLDEYMIERFPEEEDNSVKKGHINPRPYYMAVKESGVSSKAKTFTEKLPTLGECTLYLLKSSTSKDKIIYMRRPLMFVYGKRTQTSYGVYGTFVCTNTKGDKILQSMENPAHNEWKPSNYRDENNRIVDKGTDAMNEIHDFIMRSFASLFANAEDTALEITGLDELLYVPEGLIEDDEEKDQEIGSPTGYVKDEGISLTTDITDNQAKQKEEADTANVGSVKIIQTGSSEELREPEPEYSTENIIGIGGHRKKKSRTKGGKPTAGEDFKEANIQNADGSYKTYLPVRFRVAAQNENGKNYHHLIIHSERDVIEGELELITIGEQNDDIVDIIYSDNGEIKQNFLTGVVLEEGKNTIKILFSDNMRHAIKLKAYENK